MLHLFAGRKKLTENCAVPTSAISLSIAHAQIFHIAADEKGV
ncbi:MAG: hypothetical protein AAF653_00335 [Chloroflexota bacterium]